MRQIVFFAVRLEQLVYGGLDVSKLGGKIDKKSSLCQQFVHDLFYPFLTCIRDCLAHKILRISSRDYPEHRLDASAGIE